MVAVPLSIDHKPELPEEEKRILSMGGRIDSFHDTDNNNEPLGPQRVWLPDQELPGLAMSRSLGDTVAHSVGVSSVPEVKSFLISPDDKFIVIGSDGVWEFLSNEEVAEIVLPFYKNNQPESAANEIVKAAYRRWREEEEVVDDTTAVVIFMEPLMAYHSADLNRPRV
jgi:serine/threonine protein phosphatase PrpC